MIQFCSSWCTNNRARSITITPVLFRTARNCTLRTKLHTSRERNSQQPPQTKQFPYPPPQKKKNQKLNNNLSAGERWRSDQLAHLAARRFWSNFSTLIPSGTAAAAASLEPSRLVSGRDWQQTHTTPRRRPTTTRRFLQYPNHEMRSDSILRRGGETCSRELAQKHLHAVESLTFD